MTTRDQQSVEHEAAMRDKAQVISGQVFDEMKKELMSAPKPGEPVPDFAAMLQSRMIGRLRVNDLSARAGTSMTQPGFLAED